MFKEKIKEYKSTIETLEAMDPLEIYSYLMQKGQDLNKDALSERYHTQENKVTQCTVSYTHLTLPTILRV